MDLSLIALVFPLAIILGLIVAVWVRMVSSGSVIFSQTRIGRGGVPFTIYKFRSMRNRVGTSAHEIHVQELIRRNESMTKLDLMGDDRLILGGCFLRATGLDELPQLLNVIRGEMSLVGPRPCLEWEYELHSDEQKRRFMVQPGITGAWQVKRRTALTFREMTNLDADYAGRLSIWNDFKILMSTPGSLVLQVADCFRARVKGSVSSGKQASACRERQSVTGVGAR